MTKESDESRIGMAAAPLRAERRLPPPVAHRPSGTLVQAAASRRPHARRARTAPCVLHVDGDAEAALVLAILLMPEARVVHVDTLAAASRAIAEQDFALVVLDPDLPDGEGGALMAALAARGAGTPLLLYARRLPVWRMQAAACLHKERTTPRQLWHTLERLLGPVMLPSQVLP